MKKILTIIGVLLLLGGVGSGIYYYFFMMDAEDEVIDVVEEISPIVKNAPSGTKTPVPMNMDYFVAVNKLNVRAYPRKNAFIRSVVRKGKALKALEVKGDWVRVSEYEVHSSGNDVADWVHTDYLSHDKPVITAEEIKRNMMKLVNKSDDYIVYEDQFLIATQHLIENKTCSYEDFELMEGWILSRTYNMDPVYFVYCGGTGRGNKVYLNVETGKVFRP